jgi:CBS domain containing-hemolysin-like protein
MTVPNHSGFGARSTSARRLAIACVLTLAFALAAPREAHASLLSEEAEDKLATFLALFVLFIVPVVLIVLFWMVHVLPEKIAHQRHHPQFEAIRTLCLLSLVFGGLLWPIAWIWAYSKPVMYKIAYGTDKVRHGEYAGTEGEADSHAQPVAAAEVASLHDRLARLEDRVPAAELTTLRADLDALEAKFVQGAR